MNYNVWEKDGKLHYEDTEKSRNTLRFAKKLLDEGLLDNMSWSQATPYPGSFLYDTAVKYKLIPKKYQNKWEYWNHSWSLIMKLPHVSNNERMSLKIEGTTIQMLHLLKSGNLPFNSYPLLFSRGIGFVKRFLENRVSRLSSKLPN